MKFLRHLLGITKLDKEKNQCIREKTVAQNIVKEIKRCQEKWLQHVQRMDINRIPKQALQYQSKRRRNYSSKDMYGLDDPAFEFRQKKANFLYSKSSIRAIGPTQLFCNGYSGFFLGIKQPERDVDNSHPSSAVLHTYSPRCVFVACGQ